MMTVKQIVLTLDVPLADKLERHAQKLGFTNTQKYLYDLIRRSLHAKGGHPKLDPSKIDPYVTKFATPTKETYKILKTLQKT